MKILTKEHFVEFICSKPISPAATQWIKKQDTARDIIEKCPDDYLYYLVRIIGGPMLAELNDKITKFDIKGINKIHILVREICTFERVQDELGT